MRRPLPLRALIALTTLIVVQSLTHSSAIAADKRVEKMARSATIYRDKWNFYMKNLATISLLMSTLACIAIPTTAKWRCSACQLTSFKLSLQQSQQVDEFLRRWKDEAFKAYLDGASWSLLHSYSDSKRMQEVLKMLQSYFEAFDKYEKGNPSLLDQMGGIKALKDKMAGFLDDNDPAIRAFAATVLGVSGDRAYAPQIAKLLNRKEHNNKRLQTDKREAALALGLLGAKEYADELVVLLESANEDDRAGAAMGLGLMGAKEKAAAVAKLLNDNDDLLGNVRSNAIYSLIALEAKEYLQEIAKKLLDDDDEVQVAAIDALVAFGAKEYVKDIAKKLHDLGAKERALSALLRFGAKEYIKEIAKVLDDDLAGDHAALVLALMGANEHKKRIARMLNGPSGSPGAMLALGIMKASEYGGLISIHLKNEEEIMRDYAALALVLMEARQYGSEAVSRIEKSEYGLDILKRLGLYKEDYLQLRSRASESLKKLKAKR